MLGRGAPGLLGGVNWAGGGHVAVGRLLGVALGVPLRAAFEAARLLLFRVPAAFLERSLGMPRLAAVFKGLNRAARKGRLAPRWLEARTARFLPRYHLNHAWRLLRVPRQTARVAWRTPRDILRLLATRGLAWYYGAFSPAHTRLEAALLREAAEPDHFRRELRRRRRSGQRPRPRRGPRDET